jgi:ADP-ribose pyrophosphatase
LNSDPNSSPKVERHLLFHGAKFDFERLVHPGADGKPLTREVIRHPGAVLILPILEIPGAVPQIILIRNWRVSIEQWLLELPAGTLEPNETPVTCAARELEEETGYRAATLTQLCRFYTSPGLSDELMWAFVARGLSPVGQNLQPDEQVTVHPTGVGEVLKMISSDRLVDGKSVLAVLLAARLGLIAS